ncbi:MAG: ABC transporter ATP-binding protein/permease, partial [Clostridia bacterium]|nr:ABC transporter ATP-binding protein/permease [Clostridia bacterium]
MLKLSEIKKDYLSESDKVTALQGVSLQFRKSEFVSILGPSGCGKTTLLNIIGGLDHYTSGDLVIDGKSTKDFRDSDWDTYRNHSIGFVFQSYNLIPHQSVLANVELALTLSGVSKAERRKKAAAALEKVGLKDQMKKRPNQLSGGQMQRVAIARALVNDPDILLADEPTGALDSVTSIQIMELLKEISQNKLVIMVTHNPELAEEYSTRIIKVLDGKVVDDSNPYDENEEKKAVAKKSNKKEKKPTMSFFTALSLSTNNLMTKKGRTLLTAFAGSIGIIGIALILALSHGINAWIYDTQESTLSSSPISIQAESVDMSALMTSLMGINDRNEENAHELDAVYSSSVVSEMINSVLGMQVNTNNLTLFKEYLDSNEEIRENVTNIQYSYALDMNVYTKDENGDLVKSDIEDIMTHVFAGIGIPESAIPSSSSSPLGGMSSFGSIKLWQEMLPGEDGKGISPLIKDQYTLVSGDWPKSYDEVILVVNENQELSDLVLCGIGLIPTEKLIGDLNAMKDGNKLDSTVYSWSYDKVCGKEFKIYLPTDLYRKNENGGYTLLSDDDESIKLLYNGNTGVSVTISGIVRLNDDATGGMLTGAIGYTSDLTQYLLEKTAKSDIISEQEKNPDTDIILGLPFKPEDYKEPSSEEKAAAIREHLMGISAEEKAAIYLTLLAEPTDSEIEAQMKIFEAMSREELEELLLKSLTAQAKKDPDNAVDPSTMAELIKSVSDEMLLEGLRDGVAETLRQRKLSQLSARYSTPVLAALFDARLGSKPLSDLETGIKSDVYLEAFLTVPAEQLEAQMAPYTQMSRDQLEAVLLESMGQSGEEAKEAIKLADTPSLLAQLQSGMEDAMRKAMAAGMKDSMPPEAIAAMLDAALGAESENPLLTPFTVMELSELYEDYMPATYSDSSLKQNLKTLGKIVKESPSAIHIYTDTFEKKDRIAELIDEYNKTKSEEDKIEYTDLLAFMMSSLATIINAISYVLVAFVSISLVVSSIMIGIITYISVLERTKEIGILRAIGASKKDISRVFNAESVIQGFAAGVIGIAVTLILMIPINLIIHHLTGINNLGAVMPVGGYLLIGVSVLLSFIAGLLP